eukprot:TRINITY_DN28059_c0_g1_i1.p1 TRINITY_DN28059_c0_g1~~TRINITY_DN28059_c0_g1_i1.p1  ORF type:complete len:370 (+),score=91.77 TRINITY_DN28059_c0_g1_i1:25-1134(+)
MALVLGACVAPRASSRCASVLRRGWLGCGRVVPVRFHDAEATAADSGIGFHGASSSSSLDVHKPRPVRPLIFESEQLLFESDLDIQGIILIARRKCFAGAGLALGGFYALLASAGGALPLELLMLLLGTAAANSYVLVVLAQRLIRNLATRHVDRLVILPTPKESLKEQQNHKEEEEASMATKLLLSLASVEERLAITPEVRLQVRTASSERWFSLVEPLNLGDDGDEDLDLVSQRASFADICKELRLLDIDEEEGMCHEQALVAALKSSGKILVDERAEPRSDVFFFLSVPQGMPALGIMLSEVSKADVVKAGKVAKSESVADAIESIGRRAFSGGACVLAGGFLFILGEQARDADGVARWNRLKLPF